MSRSRTGCTTCKIRKKKCDESRPSCLACLSRGVPCGGYTTQLTWCDSVASRGYLAGSTVPVREAFTKVQSPSSSSISDGLSFETGDSPYSPSSGTVLSQNNSPNFGLDAEADPSGLRNLDRVAIGDDEIIQEFLDDGIHRLFAREASQWLQSSIIEVLPKSKILRLVCVAIQLYVSSGPTVSLLERTGEVLELFRNAVSEGFNPASHPEYASAGLLICSFHLIQGQPWTTTFRYLVDLYSMNGDVSTIKPNLEHDLRTRTIIEAMCVLDMPGFVLGRVSPSIMLWLKFRALQDTWNGGRMVGIEPISGLPRNLVDIIAKSHVDKDGAESDLLHWQGEVSDQLSDCHLQDCYRYATILDIRRRRNRLAILQDVIPTESIEKQSGTDLIMYRLLCILSALLNEGSLGPARPLQLQHLALMPLLQASLQVTLLKARPTWKDALLHMRDKILSLESGPTHHTLALYEILDEAWESGSDLYDADEAARRKGVEISIF